VRIVKRWDVQEGLLSWGYWVGKSEVRVSMVGRVSVSLGLVRKSLNVCFFGRAWGLLGGIVGHGFLRLCVSVGAGMARG